MNPAKQHFPLAVFASKVLAVGGFEAAAPVELRDGNFIITADGGRVGERPEIFPSAAKRKQPFRRLQMIPVQKRRRFLGTVRRRRDDLHLILAEVACECFTVAEWVRRLRKPSVFIDAQRFPFQPDFSGLSRQQAFPDAGVCIIQCHVLLLFLSLMTAQHNRQSVLRAVCRFPALPPYAARET